LATVQVTDDDAPALIVTLDVPSMAENGGTAEATVHRNTGSTETLAVNLSSSDTGEATVPASVTIPVGSDSATFTITGVDDTSVDGTQMVTITASADGFANGSDAVEVVDDETANRPPSDITLNNTVVAENAEAAVIGRFGVDDPDVGDTHTLAVSDPRFEVISGNLKLRAGQILDYEKEPTISLYVTAIDSAGLWITESFVITVIDLNEPPTAILVVNENAEGETIGILAVDDPDLGDTHTFVVSDERFEVAGGRLKLKGGVSLDYEQQSEVSVDVTASDDGGLSFTQSFVIMVNDLNERPEVSNPLTDQQSEENQPYSFAFATDTFADVDAGDSLNFTAARNDGSNLPAWLSFHQATRTFNGTPILGDNGPLAVRVTATDAGGLSVDEVFTITVAPDPNPWQNPGQDPDAHMDVDDSANVAALDVLTVINYINHHGGGDLPTPSSPAEVEYSYVDINGDNMCTPLDVLELINFINRRVGGGEGEAAAAPVVASVLASPTIELSGTGGTLIHVAAFHILSIGQPTTNGDAQHQVLQARPATVPSLITNRDQLFSHDRVESSGLSILPTSRDELLSPQHTVHELLFDFDDILDDLANDIARFAAEKDTTDTVIAEFVEKLTR